MLFDKQEPWSKMELLIRAETCPGQFFFFLFSVKLCIFVKNKGTRNKIPNLLSFEPENWERILQLLISSLAFLKRSAWEALKPSNPVTFKLVSADQNEGWRHDTGG